MADNVTLPGTGVPVATKEIGGKQFQKMLPADPTTGDPLTATLDSLAAQLPAAGGFSVFVGGGAGATSAKQDTTNAALGATTDAAITSDTNGTHTGFLRGLVKILASVWKNVTGAYYALQVTPVDSTGAPVYAVADPADDSAFTPGTSKVAPIACFADESSTDSVDEGDTGAPRMTLDRKQIVTAQPHTAGGVSVSHVIAAASMNATSVKNAAGQVYGWYFQNAHATNVIYLKLYNVSAAPDPSADSAAIMMTVGLQPKTAANVFLDTGVPFSTGIGLAITTDQAANGETAVGAGDAVVNLFYK